jgi:hypothetical protein
MNRIATLLALTAVSAAALPVPLAGATSQTAGFTQRVNGICGDAVTAIDALPAASDSAASTTRTITAGAKISSRMVSRLSKVRAPAYASKRFKTMIAVANENKTLSASIVPQARAGHTKAVESALYKIIKNDQKFADVAVDLNVGNCASITFPGYSDLAG